MGASASECGGFGAFEGGSTTIPTSDSSDEGAAKSDMSARSDGSGDDGAAKCGPSARASESGEEGATRSGTSAFAVHACKLKVSYGVET